ncbi:MAG TPA: hypothetical protein VGM77_04635 [Gemmatimonadales bacterium]|jgi:hypothetical protein
MLLPRRALLVLASLLLPAAARAQDTAAVAHADSTVPALSLFLDCRAPGCDINFLRTELTWVNYVRDRTVAQVHVIATSLATGSGGLEVTLKFIGRQEFTGVNDEVRYNTPAGATGDDLRHELARVLKVGLAHYGLGTALGSHLTVTFTAPPAGLTPTRHAHDPWNFWVFGIGLNASLNGQSADKSHSESGSLSASRTTAQWKFRANAYGSSSQSTYQLDDTTTYVADSHYYSGNTTLVRSLGDHFSIGGGAGVSSSSTNNVDLSVRVAPTAEFDFFKYDQYTRRRLVAQYSVGLDRYHYIDTTVYNRIDETRLDHQLSLSYVTTQPWGSANAAISGSSYLSNMQQNHLSLYTSLSVRIAKGLSISYALSYSRVRDQLSLAKAAASDAEILLQLRQLATSYTYGGSFSLNYTFGSLFNNVVNPRLGF